MNKELSDADIDFILEILNRVLWDKLSDENEKNTASNIMDKLK